MCRQWRVHCLCLCLCQHHLCLSPAVPDVKLRHVVAPHKEAAPAVAVLATTRLHSVGASTAEDASLQPEVSGSLLTSISPRTYLDADN